MKLRCKNDIKYKVQCNEQNKNGKQNYIKYKISKIVKEIHGLAKYKIMLNK